MTRRRQMLLIATGALSALGVGGGLLVANAQSPLPVPMQGAFRRGSQSPPPPTPAPRAGESPEQYRQRLLGELKPGARIVNIREETQGKPITIAGKSIHLPPDAYVEAVVTDVTCGPRPCPETPGYVIVRGRSRIAVGIATGRINAETIAAGEQGTFDFLKEALR